MKNRIKNIIIILLLLVFGPYCVSQQTVGQTDTGSNLIPLTPDFRFNDGIFLNFDQVKNNKPIPKAKIITSAEYNDREFFTTLLKNDKIYFYDAMGGRQEVNKNEIWGYSRNGILYIRVDNSFNRITYVGSLCHLVADITSYDNRYYNSPYGYNSYGSPYYSSYYNPYYSPYYSPYYGSPYGPTQVSRSEMVQYIIDFETGKLVEYTVKNVEILLMKDPDLYQEFMMLSRKKKKQMLFLFVRKFNEKNPVYLPKD